MQFIPLLLFKRIMGFDRGVFAKYFYRFNRKIVYLAVISDQVSLMFLAYMFQYDLVIKLVDTSARIFNCFVSTFVNIALCPISIRYLCHICSII